MSQSIVLCAVDFGPLAKRVLFHAAGMARALDAELRVLHVSHDASVEAHARALDARLALAPYEIALDEAHIVIRSGGTVSDVIHREVRRQGATLLVIGSRAHSGLTASVPVLLVPPTDLDVVRIGDAAALTCGPVLAAVDLSDDSGASVRIAEDIAAIANQPLLLLTVAKSRMSDHDAAAKLLARVRRPGAIKPTAMIVRRGDVATEIARGAAVEGAGLVVMGLDARPNGRPGLIASAVLRTGKAFVLAVPA
jgi:K+-sensing histidine kinase KdpD